MIGKTRNQKLTEKVNENSGKDGSPSSRNEDAELIKIKHARQNINNIDHTLFLEAQLRNLKEPFEDVITQIEQENNAVNSLKLRRNRVKRLILSMLKKLLKYPVEALYALIN